MRTAILPLLLLAPAPLASDQLHPHEVHSPSREFTLLVDPGNPMGSGPGRHSLMRGEEVVWSRELGSTLWRACVTDDGRVAGCAFSEGTLFGPLRMMVLSEAGEVVFDEQVERKQWRPHSTSVPYPEQVFHDPLGDRFVVGTRVEDGTGPRTEFWILDVDAGSGHTELAPEDHFEGASRRGQSVQEVRPLEGTPLRLVWWWLHPRYLESDREGARFSLVDPGGREIWSLEDDRDYSVEDRRRRRLLREAVRRRGAILSTGPAGRFSLWDVSDHSRIEFQVLPSAAGWRVEELASAAFDGPLLDLDVAPEPEPLLLDAPTEVELETPGARGLKAHVLRVDALGRILLQESGVPRIHAFDLEGRRLFIARGKHRSSWSPAPSAWWRSTLRTASRWRSSTFPRATGSRWARAGSRCGRHRRTSCDGRTEGCSGANHAGRSWGSPPTAGSS